MYKLNELFQTIQGEGCFTGTPAIFIRLQGCPVGCAWCDTKQTWNAHPYDHTSIEKVLQKREDHPSWSAISSKQIIDILSQAEFTAKHIVITGGEPCWYDLIPLTSELERHGYQCQIETSGTFEINTTANTFVTVSPKINMKAKMPIIASALARADEIKHPVGTQKDIDQLDALLLAHPLKENVIIALQPISQKERATQLCIDTCIERNWRLSIQTHKYLSIA
ncbi:MAG: 7-carboxy-7-deazaguanine synthase QueE [Aliivibrio sp.]|uniref:7-carboxy-7-deazaguanine synthase QueE n=1 Tax=Aliivibrio sp. TaxID=1872443 RepID=UPI001A5AE8BC|nr:7-carboxy-7-deazaguanine synthase QueE [Aliivibrio sp.]